MIIQSEDSDHRSIVGEEADASLRGSRLSLHFEANSLHNHPTQLHAPAVPSGIGALIGGSVSLGPTCCKPKPAATRHLTVVQLDHDVVWQTVAATWTVAVKSTSPKLTPSTVIIRVELGPLTGLMRVPSSGTDQKL